MTGSGTEIGKIRSRRSILSIRYERGPKSSKEKEVSCSQKKEEATRAADKEEEAYYNQLYKMKPNVLIV